MRDLLQQLFIHHPNQKQNQKHQTEIKNISDFQSKEGGTRLPDGTRNDLRSAIFKLFSPNTQSDPRLRTKENPKRLRERESFVQNFRLCIPFMAVSDVRRRERR